MLGWLWNLLVSFFTFVLSFIGVDLKKKSVSFAEDVKEGGGDNATVVPVSSVAEEKPSEVVSA